MHYYVKFICQIINKSLYYYLNQFQISFELKHHNDLLVL